MLTPAHREYWETFGYLVVYTAAEVAAIAAAFDPTAGGGGGACGRTPAGGLQL